MALMHLFRTPALTGAKKNELLSRVRREISQDMDDIKTEYCFNIEAEAPLSPDDMNVLRWLLCETFEPGNFSEKSFLEQGTDREKDKDGPGAVIEVGPRMNFTTAWSTNAVAVCHAHSLAGHWPLLTVSTLLGLMIIARHRENIRRLFSGQELSVSSAANPKAPHE